MKKALVIFAALLLCLAGANTFAEYYQYIDQNGVRHFTDNILEVPENQRKKLKVHQSIDSKSAEPAAPAKKQITPEELIVKKDELDRLHDDLMKKRDELNQQKEKIGDKRYNERATALNKEIKAYQAKSKAYEELILEYNRQITALKNKNAAPPASANQEDGASEE